jgi:hypothetical protein
MLSLNAANGKSEEMHGFEKPIIVEGEKKYQLSRCRPSDNIIRRNACKSWSSRGLPFPVEES